MRDEVEEQAIGNLTGVATAARWRHQAMEIEMLQYINFLLRLTLMPDQWTTPVEEFLQFLSQGERDSLIPWAKRVVAASRTMVRFTPLITQMQLSRSVDNLLCYISELLTLIYRANPKTLSTDESSVTLSYMLRYQTMEELVGALAESRVNELAYKGLRELARYLSKRIGFDLYASADDMATAVRIIEQRNLIVHNRGIINAVFVSRLPEYESQLGKPLDLSPKQVDQDVHFLLKSVADIDRRACEKFKLPNLTESSDPPPERKLVDL